MTGPRLRAADLSAVDAVLAPADALVAGLVDRVGPAPGQPVHTLYLPADRVRPGVVEACTGHARAALDGYDAESFAAAVRADPAEVAAVWPRLLEKLERDPVEDLRIDCEDGYRGRSDAQEDADVVAAVRAVAGAPPGSWGLRIRSLERATRARGLRTLDLALGAVLEAGPLPEPFRVTLPKVTSAAQVAAMVLVCELLEEAYELPAGVLRFEVQVETPQAVLGPDGTATVARVVAAAVGRLDGLHFGTYDYTASLGVPGPQQSLDHPAADHAKHVVQLAAAGAGIPVSDGSSNVLPVGPPAQVRAAWALHLRLVRRALDRGLYQGWDLHPAQLPTRHLANQLFHRAGLGPAAVRLRAYLAGSEDGTPVLDEPATAAALAAHLLRGVACGALGAAEVEQAVGAPSADLDRLTRRGTG